MKRNVSFLTVIVCFLVFSCKLKHNEDVVLQFKSRTIDLRNGQPPKDSVLKKYEATFQVNHDQSGRVFSRGYISKNAKNVGIYTEWYPSGKIERLGMWNIKDDSIVIGDSLIIFTNLFSNVSLYNDCRDCDKNDNNLHPSSLKGFSSSWYETGRIRTQCILNNDSGTLKEYYYPNGEIEERGYYLKNKREGNWKYFSKEGELIKNSFYKLDSILK
jgi:antitoxin component YwqK of YwqJK toxin-antitoxin module